MTANNSTMRYLFSSSAIALGAMMTLSLTAQAQPFDPVMPAQVASNVGDVAVSGDRGNYTAKFVVNAPVGTVWKVLTDYDNFEQFLPNVVSSELLKNNGNRKVFEQVTAINTVLFTRKARVRIAVTETYPRKIVFRSISGEVKSLRGVWQLKPLSGNRVAISHQVNVDPGATSGRDLFFDIYKNSLAESLAAIEQEVEKRAAN
jgi:ribosome-associated toxin RatA of RatAB toxin-antitoxin module